MYFLQFRDSITKDFKRMPEKERQKIWLYIQNLKVNPRSRGCKKLEGRINEYRIRFGKYRIIYTINDKEKIVLIIRVGQRKEIYR